MRKAARTKGARAQVSSSVSIPSPVGGWNARESLAAMPPTDAVILKNWYPATTECMVRYGYSEWATGFPAAVESLMQYSGGSSSKLFAVSNSACYDITSGGAIGASEWSGKSNSRWNAVNISTSGGNFLIAANGLDSVLQYNGSAWSNPAITGVTSSSLKSPIVFKNRLWFIEKNTLKTWYLPTSSIAGAANAHDMSAVAQLGGYIVAHGTWTIDAGTGIDDFYVAVTSNGEVIVYQGTDPTDSTKWALKGVWQVGAPVGDRCIHKYAGDLLLISQDGLLPLSAALQSSRVNPKVSLTDKIQYAVSNSVTSYGDNFGWDLLYFPKQNQLWLNVPVTNAQEQYCMNTITRNWSQYTGWNANCWELWNDDPYFGGSNFVGKAWDTYADAGTNIDAVALQSFSSFKNPAILKRFTMMRPILRTSGRPAILGSVNIDFNTDQTSAPLSYAPPTYGTWDSATWDSGIWSGDLSIYQDWQGVAGIGYYAAPQLNTASKDIDTRWVSTELVYESGQII